MRRESCYLAQIFSTKHNGTGPVCTIKKKSSGKDRSILLLTEIDAYFIEEHGNNAKKQNDTVHSDILCIPLKNEKKVIFTPFFLKFVQWNG